jgi:hypothetical protein
MDRTQEIHEDMPMPSNPNQDRIIYLFPLLAFSSILYYNLTPFFGTDCWWHMRFAEHFLKHGEPVIYDPFAIQNGQIMATYPDLFPGLLFLLVFKAWSFLGLNALRIIIYMTFIGVLIGVVRSNWSAFSVLVQVLLLAMAMSGRVILQPDLFNYVLFTLWIYILEDMRQVRKQLKYQLFTITVIELIWINTHMLFIFYGLVISSIYFGYTIFYKFHINNVFDKSFTATFQIILCLLLINTIWLINPLGWRAIQSLFINMIDHNFFTPSTQSFKNSLF